MKKLHKIETVASNCYYYELRCKDHHLFFSKQRLHSSSPDIFSLWLPASPSPASPYHKTRPQGAKDDHEGDAVLPVDLACGTSRTFWRICRQKTERMTSEGKKDKDQSFAADSYVLAFHFLISFAHFELFLSLLASPKDLIHSHHQPLHKIFKSITDGFTEESFNLTSQIITGLHSALCHQWAKQPAPDCGMILIHTRQHVDSLKIQHFPFKQMAAR